MTSPLEIEKAITNHLQKTVTFSIETKILKKGKLILFCIKDFFCVFTLLCEEKKNKKIIYEIPYPFDLHLGQSGKLVFDYTVNSFCKVNKNLAKCINSLPIKKPAKLYNKKITITPL